MRSSTASRICVVNIAIVVHSAGASSILVGVSIELKRVLIVTTVHMTNTNLEIAEACWINSSTGGLGLVVEVDSHIVRRAVSNAKTAGGAVLEGLKFSSQRKQNSVGMGYSRLVRI